MGVYLSPQRGGRSQSLLPVTTAQVHSAVELEENSFKISDKEINQVREATAAALCVGIHTEARAEALVTAPC